MATPAYLFAMGGCASIVARGGPGYLNVLVPLFAWNAMKFVLMGVLSLPRLFRAALRDRQAQRMARGMG